MKSRPSLFMSLIPVVVLIVLLATNVLYIYGDNAVSGANQWALMLAGAVAAGLAMLFYKVPFDKISNAIAGNIKDTTKAILILFLIGALAGSWLISGVIPTMVFYGLKILHPSYFLPASVIVCAVVSLATGSSWGTTATIGIALMGIGETMGMNGAMVAGAVISGAYFGDKLSPMSDTTNLAAVMAGTDLFTHIKYMLLTTVPSIIITLIIFIVIGFTFDVSAVDDTDAIGIALQEEFNITPWLLLVPVFVIILIAKKVDAIIALLGGVVLASVFAVIFQPEQVNQMGADYEAGWQRYYFVFFESIVTKISIPTDNEMLADLLTAKGMEGMMGTIWLVLSAMIFGGAMEAAGFLTRIAESIISVAHSTAGLIASTLATCGLLNVTASDQFLAIVVPGKMYKDVYKERGLAPENLSRSLEDGGTVTSVLIPWNTCGAYQAATLGIATGEYWMYCFFNIISPFMSLAYAVFGIKIKKLEPKKESA
jgi:NhaC family Na+:H+ antiporter